MHLIRESSDPTRILDDLEIALARARMKPALEADAATRLAAPIAEGQATTARRKAATLKVESLRLKVGQLRGEVEHRYLVTCEQIFNAVGRHRSDSILRVILPFNISQIRTGEPLDVVARVREACGRIVTIRHPQITEEEGAAAADALLAGCARLEPVARELKAAELELADAKEAQNRFAIVGRRELLNLKRLWLSKNMSAAAIHEVIPGYSRRRKKAPAEPVPAGNAATPPSAPGDTTELPRSA